MSKRSDPRGALSPTPNHCSRFCRADSVSCLLETPQHRRFPAMTQVTIAAVVLYVAGVMPSQPKEASTSLHVHHHEGSRYQFMHKS